MRSTRPSNCSIAVALDRFCSEHSTYANGQSHPSRKACTVITYKTGQPGDATFELRGLDGKLLASLGSQQRRDAV